VACADEVDREILSLLFELVRLVYLLKDLAIRLERFKVTRRQVSRRLLRMNKQLEQVFGEHVAEKRGWHWALTSFAMESRGKTKREIEEDARSYSDAEKEDVVE
jgi:hypothetical protein